MAKKSHGSFGSSVSGRLPQNYGDPEAASLRKMDTSPARSDSKEFAAGSPRVSKSTNQEEGPAGRQKLGIHELKVKKEHFNRVREEAHKMSGSLK